jgi:hypothetical protein
VELFLFLRQYQLPSEVSFRTELFASRTLLLAQDLEDQQEDQGI